VCLAKAPPTGVINAHLERRAPGGLHMTKLERTLGLGPRLDNSDKSYLKFYSRIKTKGEER